MERAIADPRLQRFCVCCHWMPEENGREKGPFQGTGCFVPQLKEKREGSHCTLLLPEENLGQSLLSSYYLGMKVPKRRGEDLSVHHLWNYTDLISKKCKNNSAILLREKYDRRLK